MGPDDKALLVQLKATLDENNVMLKTLVRQGKIMLWTKIGYWVFIILLTVGAFALVKPMLSTLGNIYAPGGMGASLQMIGDPATIEELRSQFAE